MTVFQRILVPVDFTPASEEAIQAGTAVCAGQEHVEISDATRRAVKLAAEAVALAMLVGIARPRPTEREIAERN